MREYEILFVDDDAVILDMIERYLKREGYRVSLANSAQSALQLLKSKNFDIVFTDIKMPEMDGIELLSAIKEYRPETEVIIVTGHGSMESAIQAMKIGSYDYLQKPFKLDILKLIIDRILEKKRLQAENVMLKARIKERHRYGELVGISLRMQEIFEIIDRMKDNSPNVLIQGESGSGKALTAHVIYRNSDRSGGSLLPVNCRTYAGDIPADERSRRLEELLASAAGATLYLDEITDIAPETQLAFVRRIKGKEPDATASKSESDVRVIAATRKDLKEAIAQDQLQRDFLNYVNAVSIKIPPLRERKEDICLLVHHFLHKQNSRNSRQVFSLTPEALDYLLRYHWPGNVIQLETVIERAFALGVETLIDIGDLPEEIKTFGDISKRE
jgi:DNA-binding NtrC family response regulator